MASALAPPLPSLPSLQEADPPKPRPLRRRRLTTLRVFSQPAVCSKKALAVKNFFQTNAYTFCPSLMALFLEIKQLPSKTIRTSLRKKPYPFVERGTTSLRRGYGSAGTRLFPHLSGT